MTLQEKTTAPFQRWFVLLVLALVFAQGIVRLAVVPLWAHYDEPTHFEYVRYVAEHHTLPTHARPDRDILKRIAASFGDAQIGECRRVEEGVPCLRPGHQFGEMPAYYVLQAIFQVILRPATIEAQVWLARCVSVLLAVIVAWLAYLIIRQGFPHDRLLAFGTPLVMALIFAYSDLMSAISNDVGAVAAVTLLTFAVVLIIRQGLHIETAVLVVFSAILCYLTKTSAWIGLPLAALGLLLALWPRLPRSVRIAILAMAIVTVAVSVDWLAAGGPQLHPRLSRLIPLGDLNRRLRSWYDWAHNGAAYWTAVRWQFVSFWSAFSTGVEGLPRPAVAILAAISGIGGTGALLALVRHLRARDVEGYQWRIVLFCATAVGATLVMSLLRIDPPNEQGRIPYIPTARHFYVAIVPTVMFLLIGLGAWVPPRLHRYGLAALMLLLYALGVWSVLNVQIPWFRAIWPVPY